MKRTSIITAIAAAGTLLAATALPLAGADAAQVTDNTPAITSVEHHAPDAVAQANTKVLGSGSHCVGQANTKVLGAASHPVAQANTKVLPHQ